MFYTLSVDLPKNTTDSDDLERLLSTIEDKSYIMVTWHRYCAGEPLVTRRYYVDEDAYEYDKTEVINMMLDVLKAIETEYKGRRDWYKCGKPKLCVESSVPCWR